MAEGGEDVTILYIILYLGMGVVVGAVTHYFFPKDMGTDVVVFAVLLWPLLVCIGILIIVNLVFDRLKELYETLPTWGDK